MGHREDRKREPGQSKRAKHQKSPRWRTSGFGLVGCGFLEQQVLDPPDFRNYSLQQVDRQPLSLTAFCLDHSRDGSQSSNNSQRAAESVTGRRQVIELDVFWSVSVAGFVECPVESGPVPIAEKLKSRAVLEDKREEKLT